MARKNKGLRIDYETEFVNKKNEEGTFDLWIKMRPDPKRYRLTVRNGKEGYLSERDKLFIPLDVLEKSWEELKGKPIYLSPPYELDFSRYLEKISTQLLENWDTKYNLPDEVQISDLFLKDVKDNIIQFVILYVDLAGSTKLSAELDIETYAKIIKIFLMQMAKAINNCRGYILKYGGDCVIGYFPAETNYNSMCDNAMMAGTLMGYAVENVINPIFISKGLPQIGYHIGIDVGEAKVIDIGAKGISSAQDIIGEVMNLTAKIQAIAGRNEIMVGENIFHLIHCNWQEKCLEARLPEGWQHVYKETGEPYKVYKFNARC